MHNRGRKQRRKISVDDDYISLCGIDPDILTGFQHLERIITQGNDRYLFAVKMLNDDRACRQDRFRSHINNSSRRLIHPGQLQYDKRTGTRSLVKWEGKDSARDRLAEKLVPRVIDTASFRIYTAPKANGLSGYGFCFAEYTGAA